MTDQQRGIAAGLIEHAERFQITPGAVHPGQGIILRMLIDGLTREDRFDEQLDPQYLQREYLAQDLLRGIGRAAQISGNAVANVAGVAALLRPQVEHRK